MSAAELTIRRARLQDLDQIAACENACFEDPWSFAMLYEDICETAAALYLVAAIGDEIIGYAGTHIVIDESHITNLCIRPGYRRQGYGRTLLRALMDLSQEEGAEAVTLEVRVSNRAALHLYLQMGFTIAGIRRNYYEGREDAYVMWAGEPPSLPPGGGNDHDVF